MDAPGKGVVQKNLFRKKFAEFIATLPACLIGLSENLNQVARRSS